MDLLQYTDVYKRQLLMGGELQVIHLAKRQLNITTIPIILQTGNIGYTMCSGKKTILLKHITNRIIRLVVLVMILSKETDIAFKPSCIL